MTPLSYDHGGPRSNKKFFLLQCGSVAATALYPPYNMAFHSPWTLRGIWCFGYSGTLCSMLYGLYFIQQSSMVVCTIANNHSARFLVQSDSGTAAHTVGRVNTHTRDAPRMTIVILACIFINWHNGTTLEVVPPWNVPLEMSARLSSDSASRDRAGNQHKEMSPPTVQVSKPPSLYSRAAYVYCELHELSASYALQFQRYML